VLVGAVAVDRDRPATRTSGSIYKVRVNSPKCVLTIDVLPYEMALGMPMSQRRVGIDEAVSAEIETRGAAAAAHAWSVWTDL
jgi:hypothetical protein